MARISVCFFDESCFVAPEVAGRTRRQLGDLPRGKEQNQQSKEGLYSNERRFVCAASPANAMGLHRVSGGRAGVGEWALREYSYSEAAGQPCAARRCHQN